MTTKKIKLIYSLNDIPKLISLLNISHNNSPTVLLYKGPIGAGKTTLIKKIAKHLGVNEELKSPTYSYVQTYKLKEYTVLHYDLYRIKNQAQLFDIGFLDNLENTSNIIFIEWPEIAMSYLKNIKRIEFELSYDIQNINTRKIEILTYK